MNTGSKQMHATIQKPLDEILLHIPDDESIFVVGCGNCAEKCNSGGQKEVDEMLQALTAEGVAVTGGAATASGSSLCKLSTCEELLNVEHQQETRKADAFLVLACGQGIHTVIDATDGGLVHPGCDTVFGGETVRDDFITEYCQLCGECIVEYTGGLCPIALCAKSLLNGPCGGAIDGKCEVNPERDCGWELIYERLQKIGRLDLMAQYQEPKNYERGTSPHNLTLFADRVELAYSDKVQVLPRTQG
jgi:ferredoxin